MRSKRSKLNELSEEKYQLDFMQMAMRTPSRLMASPFNQVV